MQNREPHRRKSLKINGLFGHQGAIKELERIQAELERQGHLRFLESLDQVNQAIQGSNDMEQTMGAVLAVVLSTFGCDRAWLVYPCQPEAPAWRAVM